MPLRISPIELISHKHKIIFIHIPKCAGSSIEKFFGMSKISHKWDKTNRLYLKGWDSIHKMHLQHAKASDLLDKKLIQEKVWDEYYKFTFVRNPWDRAYSDYLWMQKDRKLEGSFEDYILKRGVFEKHLTDVQSKHNRADHLFPQHEFVYDDQENCLVDYIGKFENLESDFDEICIQAGIEKGQLPHEKKSTTKRLHYREFYTSAQRVLVAEKYAKDIELFGYEF